MLAASRTFSFTSVHSSSGVLSSSSVDSEVSHRLLKFPDVPGYDFCC